jgi:hypothetical protein
MANNFSDQKQTIQIINSKELFALFDSLNDKLQNRIVLSGMRKGANLILSQAKENLKSKLKGKSKTKNKYFKNSFKIESIKNEKNGFGLKVGVKNFKYRWLEWGTKKRFFKSKYRKQHSTGVIQATHFFYDAVEQTKEDSYKLISEGVVESLKRTVDKFNRSK